MKVILDRWAIQVDDGTLWSYRDSDPELFRSRQQARDFNRFGLDPGCRIVRVQMEIKVVK